MNFEDLSNDAKLLFILSMERRSVRVGWGQITGKGLKDLAAAACEVGEFARAAHRMGLEARQRRVGNARRGRV